MNFTFEQNLRNHSLALNETREVFSTTSRTQRMIQLSVYAVIFALSVAGNAAMLAVVCKRNRVRSCKNILLVNMIVAESAVAMVCIPFDCALLVLDQGWVFGSIMCHVLWPAQTAPFGALVLTLTAMSIERYKGIVYPMKRKSSIESTRITVALIWVFSVLLVVPYGVFLRFENSECAETWGTVGSQLYTLGLFAFHYAAPLIIITLCYTRIAVRIRAGHQKSSRIISGTKQARMKRSRRHDRAVRMVVMFVVVFALCMLPHQVVWLWITFGKDVRYSDDLLTFAYMFTFTSSFANPLVYFTHNPAFRARLLRIICCCAEEPQEGRLKSGSLLGSEDTTSAESRL